MVKRISKKTKQNNKSKRRTNKRYKKKMKGGMEAAVAVPKPFICPITHEIMNEPVIDPDGYTYERSAIEIWLGRGETSPITRNPLTSDQLVVNRALKNTIDLYKNRDLCGRAELGGRADEAGHARIDKAILERLSPYNKSTYQFWSKGEDQKVLYRVQPYKIEGVEWETVPLWDDNGKFISDIRVDEIFILHNGPENISIKNLYPRRGVRHDCVCAKVDVINCSSPAPAPPVSSGWFNLYELGYMLNLRSEQDGDDV